MNIVACGCSSYHECCICFGGVCESKFDKLICDICVGKIIERNDKGQLIHPLRRTPIPTCKCGKPFQTQCRKLSLMGKLILQSYYLTLKCLGSNEEMSNHKLIV